MATVLVVDDDDDHLELMSIAVERAGHHPVTAVDAAAAREALNAGDVDAAVIDVRMPGESGLTLCRRLRAEPATAALPVMLISADVNETGMLDALIAGADDYLTKPFQRDEFCSRLELLLLRRESAYRAGWDAALPHVDAGHTTPVIRLNTG